MTNNNHRHYWSEVFCAALAAAQTEQATHVVSHALNSSSLPLCAQQLSLTTQFVTCHVRMEGMVVVRLSAKLTRKPVPGLIVFGDISV